MRIFEESFKGVGEFDDVVPFEVDLDLARFDFGVGTGR